MNSDSKPLSSLPRRSWKWIVGVSFIVSSTALAAGFFILLSPPQLLVALFLVGGAAGALSTRQAWLSGVVVGFPLAWEQLTRHALLEFGSLSAAMGHPDYWPLVGPVSLVASGVAVLGALSGAWALGAWFRPR